MSKVDCPSATFAAAGAPQYARVVLQQKVAERRNGGSSDNDVLTEGIAYSMSDGIGRARGKDILQEGQDPRGGSMRWTFSEIEPLSFHWTAERSVDNKSWIKEVDIRARRV